MSIERLAPGFLTAWVRPPGYDRYYGVNTTWNSIRHMLARGCDVAIQPPPVNAEWLWKRQVYLHGKRWELKITYRGDGFPIYRSWYQFDTWREAIKWATREGLPPMFPVHNS